MGLDMYLEADRFLWSPEREKLQISIKIPEECEVSNITIQIGYWRKANAIHGWFVDNVQNGIDDCSRTLVSRDQLKELKHLCQKVLSKAKTTDGEITVGIHYDENGSREITKPGKVLINQNVAEEMLPTRSGFFFGGTEYDEYYLKDLEKTIKIVDRAFSLSKDWEIYYHSSW